MKQATYASIDVSKKQLDVAIRPLGKVFGVSNDQSGIGLTPSGMPLVS